MKENGYDRKNTEVLEIMNNSPHFFVSWGILIIIGIMLGLFFLLNKFAIDETITIPVEIAKAGEITELKLNTNIPDKVKVGQFVFVSIDTLNPDKNKVELIGVVDRISSGQYNAPIILIKFQMFPTYLFPGMIGNIKVSLGQKTLFRLLVESIHF